MSDLRDLYQELILDHQRHPHNFGDMESPNRHADGYNPLCGDRISLNLKVGEGGKIEDIKFKGSGCAISKASASMMTDALKGKSTVEAEGLFHQFHHLVTGQEDASADGLGKLKVFAGVRDYPARVKCASLAWHTLDAALHEKKEPVSTDDGLGSGE
jgi:nitrogen fixation NifU-like protein